MTRRDQSPDRLFMRDEQLELIDRSVEQRAIEHEAAASGATASGEQDEARRARYLERLRALLPELRKIEGFPIGTDEDILALSDPPYYTACPNPFLGEFITEHGTPYDEPTDDYHREPFAADVSEGKNDPIYNAHSYHTKVPHKAIMRYILHYTKPGDVVFDGFCGTGMTGVAAQLCGSPDPVFKAQVEAEWAAAGHEPPAWGPRYAILGDLSPAATFIAYNLNRIGETAPAWRVMDNFARGLEREWQPRLITLDDGTPRDGRPRRWAGENRGLTQYTVWSDVVLCPTCGHEATWWSLTFRGRGEELADAPVCASCSARLPRNPERAFQTRFDPEMGKVVRQARTEPVLMNYAVGTRRFDKTPDASDLDAIGAIEAGLDSLDVPVVPLPDGFNTAQPVRSHGYTHVHHFFTRRNLAALAVVWSHARGRAYPERVFGLFVLTSLIQRVFRLNRYMPKHDRHVGPLSGTLYVSAITAEIPVVHYLRDKLDDFAAVRADTVARRAAITTASSTDLRSIGSDSVDYLFVDPPFGGNLNYSELNVLYEAWLGVLTANDTEAIINEVQGKGLADYQHLMTRCFEEFFRILKPARWITVEFHNSQNSVWTAIQQSLARSGFVIADVRILDKQKGTTKQLSYSNTVKKDLVISAYKPAMGTATTALATGAADALWSFIEHHLAMLPVADAGVDGRGPVFERDPALLYDRVLAYFVARGASVPLSAPAFYRELRRRYPERDGLVFLPLQATKWDLLEVSAAEGGDEQVQTYIPDEQAAIRYLRRRLTTPATYQDIFPDFTARLHPGVSLAIPELQVILEENFVADRDQWRTPDPQHEDDLRELRERQLLREYQTYLEARGQLSRVRPDALAGGFSQAWNARRYDEIVDLADRVPETVIQEDPRLLMYYDNAIVRRE